MVGGDSLSISLLCFRVMSVNQTRACVASLIYMSLSLLWHHHRHDSCMVLATSASHTLVFLLVFN